MNAEMPVPSLTEAPDRTPAFRVEMTMENVAHLVFDQPGTSANVFNPASLHDLEQAIAALRTSPGLRGVILRSAKPDIFCAGADLDSLESPDAGALGEFIALGQRVFSDLASLPVRKVAAIHGACVGGGFELALACDVRVATNAPVTKIGLPETNLGILPAWGGSTRLPRLAGLPAALSVILPGAVHPARQAVKLGLIDEVVPPEFLLRAADHWIRAVKLPKRRRTWPVNNPVSAALIARRARRDLMTKTGGHYPAPLRALDVITQSVRGGVDESLSRERAAIAELTGLPATRHVLNTFLHREKLRRGPRRPGREITNVAVIGAGVMGAGIAQWIASKGCRVLLRDVNVGALASGMKRIHALLGEGVKRGHFKPHEARAALDRITPCSGEVPLQRMDLVIEAAVEDMELKRRIFEDLAGRVRPDTILATNTSALSVRAMLASPRMAGLHFFNPVHRMPLVEVVRPDGADPAVVEALADFVRRIGKLPVIVADRPGFVVNRILMPCLMAAGEHVAEGMPPAELDAAMRDFGMPMGLLRLLDEVGLDVALHVGHTLAAAFPDRMKVPARLEEMVAAGKLGRKNGRGFYEYGRKGNDPSRLRRRDEAWRVKAGGAAAQLARLMSEEAQRCLDDGVVSGAADIDFAMIAGAGYPAFRGGPLSYAADGFPVHSNPPVP